VNDAAIGDNQQLLDRYIEEIGRDAQLVFIEMMRGSQVVAGYHTEKVTPEEDVLMRSYPLSVGETGGESLKIGFSKTAMNRQVTRVKQATGVASAAIAIFLVIVFVMVRMRSKQEAKIP